MVVWSSFEWFHDLRNMELSVCGSHVFKYINNNAINRLTMMTLRVRDVENMISLIWYYSVIDVMVAGIRLVLNLHSFIYLTGNGTVPTVSRYVYLYCLFKYLLCLFVYL